MTTVVSERLWAYALFAGALSSAGVPLYLYAPKFYFDNYGVGLATLGVALFCLRLLDVVQDPLLGRLSTVFSSRRPGVLCVAAFVLSSAMIGLFAVEPPVAPLLWFVLMLTLVFSTFSFLTINFYAQGVAKAKRLGPAGHLRLARWRETGGLIGICVASASPAVFAAVSSVPFAMFAGVFAAMTCMAALAMAGEWDRDMIRQPQAFAHVLRDRTARQILLIGLVNAAPVAVTSTLFLFYVESRLTAPDAVGPLLLLFFMSAALAAPLWTFLAERFGLKRVLRAAMGLAIFSLFWVLFLNSGDVIAFGMICVLSGAAVGADMTLIPAVFAQRIAHIGASTTDGFGLWSFVSKFSLAVAAVILLPSLEFAGFRSGQENSAVALGVLTWTYALVPCALKLLAIAVLQRTDLRES
ncbi:MAG: sugar:cation symporter [Rhodobacteraceae bacterium]|nr:sugar:cation symporter [Paracoccaceae bacterium]